MKKLNVKKYFSSARVILLGFLGLILIGSILLVLPFSSADGSSCSYSDALFTSVSAVCVTGLVVVDTATHWSLFGQIVILLLIQIGGLGVVTVVVLLTKALGIKIGLSQRSTVQEAVSAPKISGILKFTQFIFIFTFACEFIGAVAMAPAFIKNLGWAKGIWASLFHSVSAFCNAGFDILGTESAPFSSLTGYASDPLINIVVMLLIIIGGLGFVTWEDIKRYGFRIKKYCVQSKLILCSAAILIFVPAIYFFFAEFSYMPFGKRLLCSLFQAVSPRTAGFNTVDASSLSDAGRAVTVVLMLIGGAPGSTAGGMKTTTAALLVATAFSVFRKKEDTDLFGRRIGETIVRRAIAIASTYIALAFVGGVMISVIEKLPFSACLFETASAIGTVGLTTGITPLLSIYSRIILMALMFFGRAGCLTLIYAAVASAKTNAKLPEDKLSVG
ncbi:MAG: TrkH family potassium uptake protein [Christensenellales bacterium]